MTRENIRSSSLVVALGRLPEFYIGSFTLGFFGGGPTLGILFGSGLVRLVLPRAALRTNLPMGGNTPSPSVRVPAFQDPGTNYATFSYFGRGFCEALCKCEGTVA